MVLLAPFVAAVFLSASYALQCTRCDVYSANNQPACCLTFNPPKQQVVVWYGTQQGSGLQQTSGVVSSVSSGGQVSSSGNIIQTQQPSPSLQRAQNSNPSAQFSPQGPSPVFNPQSGNSQNIPGGIQYQPSSSNPNEPYNGPNTGFQATSNGGYLSPGGGFSPVPNQAQNSEFAQGGNQDWNSQNYAGQSTFGPNQYGNGASGMQGQGQHSPQQQNNYDEALRAAGSSSDSNGVPYAGASSTTPFPLFTQQAPYSQSGGSTQGVFPTAPINVYSGQTPASVAGGQQYPPGSSTPYPYAASSQTFTQGPSYPQNGMGSSQAPYGDQNVYGTSQQQQNQEGATNGQFSPAPYSGASSPQGQSSGPHQTTQFPQVIYQGNAPQGEAQVNAEGFSSSTQPPFNYETNSPQGEIQALSGSQSPYNNQQNNAQGQTQFSPEGYPSTTPFNYQTNNPQGQGQAQFSPEGYQSTTPFNYQTSNPQSQGQVYPAGSISSTQPPYQTSSPQMQNQPSSSGFASSTGSAPYYDNQAQSQNQGQTQQSGLISSSQPTPYPYQSNGPLSSSNGYQSSTQPSSTGGGVQGGLYGQNANGQFVQPTQAPAPQLQYDPTTTPYAPPSATGGQAPMVGSLTPAPGMAPQYDFQRDMNTQYGNYQNYPGRAEQYSSSSPLTYKGSLIATIMTTMLLQLVL